MVNSTPGEGTDEIDLTSTSYEELQQSVNSLKEFEPRTVANKRMLSLGESIVELRRALLKDDWAGAKAAVVELHRSDLGEMPEAQAEMHVVQVRNITGSAMRAQCIAPHAANQLTSPTIIFKQPRFPPSPRRYASTSGRISQR